MSVELDYKKAVSNHTDPQIVNIFSGVFRCVPPTYMIVICPLYRALLTMDQ